MINLIWNDGTMAMSAEIAIFITQMYYLLYFVLKDTMKKSLTFALLLFFIVLFAAPFAAASSDSDEYPLVSYPSQMFDSAVLCPVIVTGKNYYLLSSSDIFSDIVDLMSWGNIYILKYDEKGRLYPSLLAEGNYSYYYNHNQFVYAVNNGKDIFRYNITTGEGVHIVSSENDIDRIYGYDDLVFCSSGGTVYLCRISEGTLKEIYKNNDMTSFCPVTNRVVRVSVPNPFYAECLAHQFTDAASYYDWFASNKAAGPQPFSRDEAIEFLFSHSVEDFLTVFEEVPKDSLLYVDFIDNSVSDTFSYSPSSLVTYNNFVTEVDSFYKAIEEGESKYTIDSEVAVPQDIPPQTSDFSAFFYVLAVISGVCCCAFLVHKNPLL